MTGYGWQFLMETEKGPPYAPAPKPFRPYKHAPKPPREIGENRLGEAVKTLRKARGISQDVLAARTEIDRTTIARLESGKFKILAMEKLKRIAEALGVDLKTLLAKSDSDYRPKPVRGNTTQSEFVLNYPKEGFQILSLIPKRKDFFFGRIEIKPKKTIPTQSLPHADQVCLHVLDGRLGVIHRSKEMVLKPGESFSFCGFSDYEFFNSDQFKTVSALFITSPSFIPF